MLDMHEYLIFMVFLLTILPSWLDGGKHLLIIWRNVFSYSGFHCWTKRWVVPQYVTTNN